LSNIAVPSFDDSEDIHTEVADLSCNCHEAEARGATGEVAQLENEIDQAAAELWGITDSELRAIQDALEEMT
ncbi:MAG: hypothetical protein ABEI13_02430, partial [Candidatus Paceibacteria bacterium]